MKIRESINSKNIDTEKFALWGNLFQTLIKAHRNGNFHEKYQDLIDHLSGRSKEALQYFYEFIKTHSDELLETVNSCLTVEYENKDTLNPVLFTEDSNIKPKLRKALLSIARYFISLVDEPLDVIDITITGSNVNYNWHSDSDIDIHVVVDLTSIDQPDTLLKYYKTFSGNFNKDFRSRFKTHPVELYIQDKEEPHHSTGVYSILYGKWVIKPEYSKVQVPDSKIVKVSELFQSAIDSIESIEDVSKIKDTLKKFRSKGLSRSGEYSIENLVFKNLRNNGYLNKLKLKVSSVFQKKLDKVKDE